MREKRRKDLSRRKVLHLTGVPVSFNNRRERKTTVPNDKKYPGRERRE